MARWLLGLLAWGLLAGPAGAAELPDALMLDGHPLDPLCFQGNPERAGATELAADVADCRASEDVVSETDPAALAPDDRGWIAYEFGWADMPDIPLRGWVGWRYVGTVADGPVVETSYNGGGSGFFSAVMVVRRHGNRLERVRTLAGGDRCNGGVAGAAVAGGQVVTASHLTPYDLVSWALEEAGGTALPEDAPLAFCAACCVGTATFVEDEPAWVTVTPSPEGFAHGEADTMAVCLDGLLEELSAPAGILDRAAMGAFGQQFRERCLN